MNCAFRVRGHEWPLFHVKTPSVKRDCVGHFVEERRFSAASTMLLKWASAPVAQAGCERHEVRIVGPHLIAIVREGRERG